MNRTRIIVADDEPLARTRITDLLSDRREIEVVGECATGAETVTAIRDHRPDLLFLDIQLSDMNGFELLRLLDPDELPVVIFVTAFDRYAVRAFEIHAVDFLLKPFDDDRFQDALDRGCRRVREERGGQLMERLDRMLQDGIPRHPTEPGRLVVKSANATAFIDYDEIDWIGAEGSYVRIHAGSKNWLYREAMHRLEERLVPQGFCRIHRSTIVATKRIREFRRDASGAASVILTSGERLVVGASFRDGLTSALKQG